MPTVPCFLLFTAYRQFLQARGRMGPATLLIYAANVFNALLAWALVFGAPRRAAARLRRRGDGGHADLASALLLGLWSASAG